MQAPFIPKKGDNFDRAYCEQKEKPGVETRERYEKYYAEGNVATAFKEFYYFIDASLERQETEKQKEKVNSLKKSKSDGQFKLPVIGKNRVQSTNINGDSLKLKQPSLNSINSTNMLSTKRKTNKSVSARASHLKV